MDRASTIYLIESRNRQDLADMFMRFQEYYESPEYKGKVFSADEFSHWYTSKYGSFSYAKDWYGFNIPGTVLIPFRNGDLNPLADRERELIDFCKKADDDSYIIGVTPSAEYFKETVRHEFLHGAFYINSEYRREVEVCVKYHGIKSVDSGLRKMGYCGDVVIDETNAYVLVEPDTIQEYASIRNTKYLRERLGRIFEKHFGFSILEAQIPMLMAKTEHVLV